MQVQANCSFTIAAFTISSWTCLTWRQSAVLYYLRNLICKHTNCWKTSRKRGSLY